MKRKKILVVACLTATAMAGTFTFAARTNGAVSLLGILTNSEPLQTKKTVVAAPPHKASAPSTTLPVLSQTSATMTSSPEIPPQIAYHFLFKRIELLEQKAGEMDSRGEDGSKIRKIYRQTMNLTDEQNAFLFQTAADCMAQVRITDDTARPIIEQVAAQRQAQSFSPDEVPPTSPELTALQTQREQTVISYREMLRNNFGEQAFARLEEFVKEKISSNVTTNVDPQNSAVPTTPLTAPAGAAGSSPAPQQNFAATAKENKR